MNSRILLLMLFVSLCPFACSKKDKDNDAAPVKDSAISLPEYYGLYAVDDGKTVRFKSGLAESFGSRVEFLLYDKSVNFGVRPHLLSIPLKPKIAARSSGEFSWSEWFQMTQVDAPRAAEEQRTGVPADAESVDLLIKPVPNQTEMIRMIPSHALTPGLYQLDRTRFWVDQKEYIRLKTADANGAIERQDWRAAYESAWAVSKAQPDKALLEEVVTKAASSARTALEAGDWDKARAAALVALQERASDRELLDLLKKCIQEQQAQAARSIRQRAVAAIKSEEASRLVTQRGTTRIVVDWNIGSGSVQYGVDVRWNWGVDLRKLTEKDLRRENDRIVFHLPEPELLEFSPLRDTESFGGKDKVVPSPAQMQVLLNRVRGEATQLAAKQHLWPSRREIVDQFNAKYKQSPGLEIRCE